MILWDIIRDWFVQYVWGGMTSAEEYYSGTLGSVLAFSNDGSSDEFFNANTDFTFLKIFSGFVPDMFGGNVNYTDASVLISLGDWLSTTSTIIVLVSLCVFLAFCVRYLFKFVGGLFKW